MMKITTSLPFARLSREQFITWATIILLLAGTIILLFNFDVLISDFYDFYLAAQVLVQGGNPYNPQPNGLQGFFNPLWAAFPLLSLTAFEPQAAFQLWRVLIFAMLLPLLRPLRRLYGVALTPLLFLIVMWLILLPWFIGQNAPLVAAGAWLALCFGARERWVLAGMVAPLLAMKPHTVLLFPLVLLWRGGWGVWVGGVASTGLATLAAMLFLPMWPLHLLNSRWAESQAGGGQAWPAASVLNVMESLGLPGLLYPLLVVLALALLWRYRTLPWREYGALGLGLGLVIAPYMRPIDFPLLLPALLTLPHRWRLGVGMMSMAIFLVDTPVIYLWFIPVLVMMALLLHLRGVAKLSA